MVFLSYQPCLRRSLERATVQHHVPSHRSAVFEALSKGVFGHVSRWRFMPVGSDRHQKAGASWDEVDVRLLNMALAKPRGQSGRIPPQAHASTRVCTGAAYGKPHFQGGLRNRHIAWFDVTDFQCGRCENSPPGMWGAIHDQIVDFWTSSAPVAGQNP